MTGFPHLESPRYFSKISRTCKVLRVSLESPGIHLWFKLTNIHVMYWTPCVNQCTKYSCYVQLLMNVLRWIVLSHCIYRLNNCRLSVYLNTAGLWRSPVKRFGGPGNFYKQESGNPVMSMTVSTMSIIVECTISFAGIAQFMLKCCERCMWFVVGGKRLTLSTESVTQ